MELCDIFRQSAWSVQAASFCKIAPLLRSESYPQVAKVCQQFQRSKIEGSESKGL
jgi:hypothetical protein